MEEQIPIFGTAAAAAKFWLLIFGLWTICAVVNVGIADLKERNPVIWGLIGLGFGPFGVIALLFRSSKKKAEAKKAAKEKKL